MKNMQNIKIGICGLVCSKCPKFKDECPGCQPNEVCPLPKCAEERGVNLCFECEQYPCEKNYKNGPLVKELLDFHKKSK